MPETITLTNITQITNRAISDTTGTLAINRGGTALTWAAYYSDSTLLKILLDRGLDVNAHDEDGNTPLHHALGVGRADIVTLLLQKGARVNSANKEAIFNFAILLIDEMKQYPEGMDQLARLRFLGPAQEMKNKMNALENKANTAIK